VYRSRLQGFTEPLSLKVPVLGYRACQAPLRDSERVARDRRRNQAPFGALVRGVFVRSKAPDTTSYHPGTADRPGHPSTKGGLALTLTFLPIGVAPITTPGPRRHHRTPPPRRSVAYAGGRIFIQRHDI
jgi:hypothetical protein